MAAPMYNVLKHGRKLILCKNHNFTTISRTFLQYNPSHVYAGCLVRCTQQNRHMETDARNVDVASSANRISYFDSLKLSKHLENSGFTAQEAEGLTDALMQILNTHVEVQQKQLLTKAQQEISIQQIMTHIAAIKKDMVILEKSEFSSLRNETEKLHIELAQLKLTQKNELSHMSSQMALDTNLERSRAKEDHAKNETQLAKLDNKINTEIANLRTLYEQYRNETMKYAAGAILSCLTISLGFFRLWS